MTRDSKESGPPSCISVINQDGSPWVVGQDTPWESDKSPLLPYTGREGGSQETRTTRPLTEAPQKWCYGAPWRSITGTHSDEAVHTGGLIEHRDNLCEDFRYGLFTIKGQLNYKKKILIIVVIWFPFQANHSTYAAQHIEYQNYSLQIENNQ